MVCIKLLDTCRQCFEKVIQKAKMPAPMLGKRLPIIFLTSGKRYLYQTTQAKPAYFGRLSINFSKAGLPHLGYRTSVQISKCLTKNKSVRLQIPNQKNNHMKKKKIIFGLILTLGLIWFFRYFFGYWHGSTLFVILFGSILWIVLFMIAIFQLFKYFTEKDRDKQRLLVAIFIFCLNCIVVVKPQGLINWEKWEGENILVAEMEGTANCHTIIKLRPKNVFKYTSICFGMDFYMGTYKLSNDTLYLELEKDAPYIDRKSFAVFEKLKKGEDQYKHLCIYQNIEGFRCLNMSVIENNMGKIEK
jgi:hypothetical protein